MSNPKFSIIHPSRGRPEMCFATVQNWINKAYNPKNIEYLICLDRNDSEAKRYGIIDRGADVKAIINTEENPWYVEKVNEAAKLATGDILIINTDTFDCEQDWDKKILDFIGGKTDWLLKTNDGIENWICTLPIMDRAFYENQGYVYFPEYQHMYSDTDLTSYADYAGKRLVNMDLLFDHKHYSVGKMAKDATNMRSDSTYQQGEALYIKRFKENFGVKELRGTITSPSHIAWLAQRGLTVPEL